MVGAVSADQLASVAGNRWSEFNDVSAVASSLSPFQAEDLFGQVGGLVGAIPVNQCDPVLVFAGDVADLKTATALLCS